MRKNTAFLLLCGSLAFGMACGDDDDTGTDTGTDGGDGVDTGLDTGDIPDAGMDVGPLPDPTCANYCARAITDCSASANAYGSSMADCMTWCEDIGMWPAGTTGDTTGNTIACRITAVAGGNCNAGGFTGGGVCGTYCENYCNNLPNVCEGSDAVYPDGASCMTACSRIDDDGVDGTTSGNSIQCRIYHGGIPADMSPATHCSHTSEAGLDTDGSPICAFDPMGFAFRTDAASAYTRIDRMGMPAVSTVLLTDKAGYNDDNPTDDALLPFAGEIVSNLTGLHMALDAELEDAGLAPCSMGVAAGAMLPGCLAQTVGAGGPTVASLVVPDTVTLNTGAAAGFPNGRLLTDPVIDVTLAVILLDLTMETAGALVGTNPTANDVPLLADFPYLAEAQ